MNYTILDTETNTEHEVAHDNLQPEAFMWGQWSCDCNRMLEASVTEPTPCHALRFLVIRSDHPEFDFDQWNSDYPKELKDKHRPQ